MKTQTDSERDEQARQAQLDQLKASDFFPPGVGWNQGESGNREDESEQRKSTDADVKPN